MPGRFKVQSTFKRQVRASRRASLKRGEGGFKFYFAGQPSTGIFVKSVLSIYKHFKMTPLRKEILQELVKVQKRIDVLKAEGFSFSGRINRIDEGDIEFSTRELEYLKSLTKNELRSRATGYKDVTGNQAVQELYNLEQKRKKSEAARKREAKKRAERERRKREAEEQEALDELENKINNIIQEEEDYIHAIMYEWNRNVKHYDDALDTAHEVFSKLHDLTKEQKAMVVDFWENNGPLSEVIQQSENQYYGMFYAAIRFNENLLHIMSLNPQDLTELEYNITVSHSDFFIYRPASQEFDDEYDV